MIFQFSYSSLFVELSILFFYYIFFFIGHLLISNIRFWYSIKQNIEKILTTHNRMTYMKYTRNTKNKKKCPIRIDDDNSFIFIILFFSCMLKILPSLLCVAVLWLEVKKKKKKRFHIIKLILFSFSQIDTVCAYLCKCIFFLCSHCVCFCVLLLFSVAIADGVKSTPKHTITLCNYITVFFCCCCSALICDGYLSRFFIGIHIYK